jgi:rubrerythrin
MSEMIDFMTKRIFIDVHKSNERLCSEVYLKYSELYHDTPEASQIWEIAAQEDTQNQRKFDQALELWRETKFDELNDDLKIASSINYTLLKLKNHVTNVKPDLKVAISKTIEIEEKLAKLYARTSLKFREKSLQKIFKSLSDTDQNHVANFQRYHDTLHTLHNEI